MVKNTIQKSYRTNKKAKDWLIKNGFRDIHLFPHTRFIKDVHFQGLDFDGIASINTTLVLFQIKSNRKPTKELQRLYKEVSVKFNILCLWINNVDRVGVEVYGLKQK